MEILDKRLKLEIAAFLYHDVVDHPRDSGFQRTAAIQYKHTPAAFEDHLDHIASSRMLPELTPEIDFGKAGRHLILTFDDGGKSASHISEVLVARGWKGHFLVTTGLIGTRGFLGVNEIRAIRRCGHVVGSHSHTHPDIFRAQPLEKMVEEWRTSCDRISQILSEPCVTASVPGGDISRRVFESANKAGIRYLFTSEPTLKPQRVGDSWILGRACPKADTSVLLVERMAQFNWWSWNKELTLRRLKVLARVMASPLYEIYVRHTTLAR